jgi:hypothetical protein
VNDIVKQLQSYKDLEPFWNNYGEVRSYVNDTIYLSDKIREIGNENLMKSYEVTLKEMLQPYNMYIEKNWENYPLGETHTVIDFINLRKSLHRVSLENDVVTIKDSKLHAIFNKIKNEAFDENLNEEGISDAWTNDILDKYMPIRIAGNLKRSGVKLTTLSIPAEALDLVKEARNAYAVELPTACISLCRTLVEWTIVNIAFRLGRVTDISWFEQMGLSDRIALLFPRNQRDSNRAQLNIFMEKTSRVIHADKKADMETARKIYLEAIPLVEGLYVRFKSQFVLQD